MSLPRYQLRNRVATRRRLALVEQAHKAGSALAHEQRAGDRRGPGRLPGMRSFAAGGISRQNQHFLGAQISLDAALQDGLARMVWRSRQLARDESYLRRFLNICDEKVVGAAGIRLQSRAKRDDGSPDEQDQATLEALWKEWCKRSNADIRGKRTFRDLQAGFIRGVMRDGEYLGRVVYGAPNAFKFAIQPLDPMLLDVNLSGDVPRSVGERESNEHRITMGVELDKFTRPVAYWIKQRRSTLDTIAYHGRDYMRLPASEVIHEFMMLDEADHNRGVPVGVAALLRLEMLAGFEEAELVASRASAAKMGFYKQTGPSKFAGDDEDADGRPVEEFEPATMQLLPNGIDVELFNPTHPNANAAGMVKLMLRGAAAALGVNYNTLAGDLEGVNYSSLRSAAKEDEGHWRTLQGFVTTAFCEPVFEAWLRQAFLTNQLQVPATRYEKFKDVHWQAQGFPWVDPLKESQANKVAVSETYTLTPSQIVQQQGGDWEEHIAQLERDQKDLARIGLAIGANAGPVIETPAEES